MLLLSMSRMHLVSSCRLCKLHSVDLLLLHWHRHRTCSTLPPNTYHLSNP